MYRVEQTGIIKSCGFIEFFWKTLKAIAGNKTLWVSAGEVWVQPQKIKSGQSFKVGAFFWMGGRWDLTVCFAFNSSICLS